MQEVWFMFKGMESFFGFWCMFFHVSGFSHKLEPLPHNLLYCGTFFGFTMNALFGILSIWLHAGPSPISEAFTNLLAAALHLLISMMSMRDAEGDFHLMYLSDFEEPKHPFFHYCKCQSICALVAGSLYLLHSMLAVDVVTVKEKIKDYYDQSDSDSDDEYDEEEDEDELSSLKPIRMYVFGKRVHTKLMNYAWFRRISSDERETYQIPGIRV